MIRGDAHEENESKISSTIVELNMNKENEIVTEETGDRQVSRKRKTVCQSQFEEVKASHSRVIKRRSINTQKSRGEIIKRWPVWRYALAEERMFDTMKDLGATFTNQVQHSVLRNEAHKYIRDTGLLDHLMKQMDGRVRTERFKRCLNTGRKMGYWLESAVSSAAESLEPMAETTKTKERDMNELLIEEQEEEYAIPMKELLSWQTKIDRPLNEIASCVKSLQGLLCEEIMPWKTKVEQQLEEIKTSLSSLQAFKQDNSTFPAPAGFDEWLGSSKLDDFNRDDVRLWFGDPHPDADNPTQQSIDGELLEYQRYAAEPVPKKEEEEEKEEQAPSDYS